MFSLLWPDFSRPESEGFFFFLILAGSIFNKVLTENPTKYVVPAYF